MRILFSELPDGTEYGQVLCCVRGNIPTLLLESILVSPEDQAELMWPGAGEHGWLEGPLYREVPIVSFYAPIGRLVVLYGIARKIERTEDRETPTPPDPGKRETSCDI